MLGTRKCEGSGEAYTAARGRQAGCTRGGGHPEGAQGARGAPSASAPPVTFPLRLPERPKSQAGLCGPPAALPAVSSSVPRPPSPSVALGRCQRRPRLRPGPRPRPPAADTLGGPAPLLGLTLQSRARRHLVEVLRAPEPPSWAPPAPRHDPATGGTEVGAVPHGFVCTDGPLRAPHTPCGPCPRGEKRRPASPRPGPRLNEAWPSSALEGGWIRQVHPGGDAGASGRNGTDRRPASGHGEAAGGLFSIDNTACGYVQNKSRVCPCLGRHTQASRRPRPPAGGSGRSYGGGEASRLGPMG